MTKAYTSQFFVSSKCTLSTIENSFHNGDHAKTTQFPFQRIRVHKHIHGTSGSVLVPVGGVCVVVM